MKPVIFSSFFIDIDLLGDPWFAQLRLGQEICFFALNQLILQKLFQMHSVVFRLALFGQPKLVFLQSNFAETISIGLKVLLGSVWQGVFEIFPGRTLYDGGQEEGLLLELLKFSHLSILYSQ